TRRLEDVSRRFPPEVTACHPPQLVVDERNEAVERGGISLAPGPEEPGDFVSAGGVRHRLMRGTRSILRFFPQERETHEKHCCRKPFGLVPGRRRARGPDLAGPSRRRRWKRGQWTPSSRRDHVHEMAHDPHPHRGPHGGLYGGR